MSFKNVLKITCFVNMDRRDMNKCTIHEEVTNQLVEPHYDFLHSKQLLEVNSSQVIPNLAETGSVNYGMERQRRKLVDRKELISAKKRKLPLTMSEDFVSVHKETKASIANCKKTQEEANDGLIQIKRNEKSLNRNEENNGLTQIKGNEKFLNEYERYGENFKVKESEKAKCSQKNNGRALFQFFTFASHSLVFDIRQAMDNKQVQA